MDPRFTTVKPVSHNVVRLLCLACKQPVGEWETDSSDEGVSVFEIVRESLRHGCKEAPNAVEGN